MPPGTSQNARDRRRASFETPAARAPDIAQKAVVEPGELRPLAAAPAPFLQCHENSAQRLLESEPPAAPSHLPPSDARTVSRCRVKRNSFHLKLLIWRSGRRYSA